MRAASSQARGVPASCRRRIPLRTAAVGACRGGIRSRVPASHQTEGARAARQRPAADRAGGAGAPAGRQGHSAYALPACPCAPRRAGTARARRRGRAGYAPQGPGGAGSSERVIEKGEEGSRTLLNGFCRPTHNRSATSPHGRGTLPRPINGFREGRGGMACPCTAPRRALPRRAPGRPARRRTAPASP